ncbi:MAG: hypothetical protein DU429_06825 [Candidatus Tokpelaia sp.]|nr:MAG: hypothetical protein DU430_07260 [Candidatus Tokpelaia sp.]KAA6206128.1 MAG: hypothetical protein DU429_06825 [Candidatus Tokpelaia sp.]
MIETHFLLFPVFVLLSAKTGKNAYFTAGDIVLSNSREIISLYLLFLAKIYRPITYNGLKRQIYRASLYPLLLKLRRNFQHRKISDSNYARETPPEKSRCSCRCRCRQSSGL